jgi:hypothetical protein
MRGYFFHVHDGEEMPDEEGIVLAGPAEARVQVITAAGEMLKENGRSVWTGTEWLMRVTDEANRPVFTLRFSAEEH